MMDLIGTTLGNYRIEATLGSGAMGEVFRGVHVHLNRRNAIKVMHPRLAADPSFQARFKHEAQIIAALTHPHIIGVQDFGDENNRLYLVMELADAGSLRTLLLRQPEGHTCPLPLGLELVAQAADGLAYAHKQGMIHRDIKPDNLLLRANIASPTDTRGSFTVKISDFGLARMTDSDDSMTVTGVMMGTPAYMSPEQCQGLPLDGRCDIYALGVVLYEVAVGFPPFQTSSVTEAVYKHVYTPPPSPRTLRADLSPDLERVILRCLGKKPDERYLTAADLATDVRALLQPQFAEPAKMSRYAETVIAPLPSTPSQGPTLPNSILVTLDQAAVFLTPGQPVTVPVTLTHDGPDLLFATVSLDGLPAEWVSGAGQRVELFPNRPAVVHLVVRAPRLNVTRPIAYTATVNARSMQNPVIAGSATLTAHIQPPVMDSLKVSPHRAFGFRGARYTVTLRNTDSVAADYALNVTDISPLLTYEIGQRSVHADPGQLARVRLTVRPASHWSGPHTQTLSVQSRAMASGRSARATAEYTHMPALAARVPKLVYAALALIVALSLFFILPGPGGKGHHSPMSTTSPSQSSHPLAWHAVAQLPVARFGLAVVAAQDGRIYAIGGNTGVQASPFTADVDALTPSTGSWTPVASMPTPRAALGAAAGPFNRIYAFAGVNGDGLLVVVEAYDLNANKWAGVGSVNPHLPRYRSAVVSTHDGSFYILGGQSSGSDVIDRVELYRQTAPTTYTFDTLASLSTPRSGAAAALGLNGKIYVFGGSGDGKDSGDAALSSGEVYTPSSNTWQPIAPMPTARYRAAAVTAPDGRIFVIGGKNGSGELNTVDIYNPTTNTWSAGPVMSGARDALAAALGADGHIYAIGGRKGNTPVATVEALY